MKLRADLKLVKQFDYMPKHYVDLEGNKCLGCVFAITQGLDNSLCDRINAKVLTCGANMIWVFDEEQWSNYKERL